MITTRTDRHCADSLRDNELPRDYLAEAISIVDGTSRLLPERAHLRAMLNEMRTR